MNRELNFVNVNDPAVKRLIAELVAQFKDNEAILSLKADGGVFANKLKSGTTQGNAGAKAKELWHDTTDNTIKIGV